MRVLTIPSFLSAKANKLILKSTETFARIFSDSLLQELAVRFWCFESDISLYFIRNECISLKSAVHLTRSYSFVLGDL